MLWKKRQILGVVLSILVICSFMTPQAQSYFCLQEKQKMSVGDSLELFLNLPPALLKTINVYIQEGDRLLSFEDNLLKQSRYTLDVNSPVVVRPGKVQLQLKLFGLIPLKQINVDVLPSIHLIPGGHSIGVLLRTEGVMVVGYSPILNERNEPCFPAKDADVAIGDMILEINGVKIDTDEQARATIASLGSRSRDSIELTIKRHNKIIKRVVYPQFCQDTKSYRIGLFIRDNAGGIGTLTFYDPLSKKYGALGHVISDNITNQRINIRQGKIISASIEDIQLAKRGNPGEKIGIFIEDSELGSIEKNESCGIYGLANKDLTNPLFSGTLPVAYANQIQTGPAQILTVLKGQEIKKYSIIIEKMMYGRQDGKNMIIRINDPELLQRTGGIVQGMSGSPIIQKGKIVGAVTHVFVNDPDRGYGVFIENMLVEANILQQYQQTLGVLTQGFFLMLCRKMYFYELILYLMPLSCSYAQLLAKYRGKFIHQYPVFKMVKAGNKSQLSKW